MPDIQIVSREEAIPVRSRTGGVRSRRMQEFDEYVKLIVEHSDEALILSNLDEPPQKFVLTLRAALRRHGIADAVIVRHPRGTDTVRVWFAQPGEQTKRTRRPRKERELVPA